MIHEANIHNLRDFVVMEMQYARELLGKEKKEVVDVKKFMGGCHTYCINLLQNPETKVYFHNQWEGFCVVYVSGARWFQDKVAYMDHFWLSPTRRQPGKAEEFALEVEKKLKEDGIKEIYLLFTPLALERAGSRRAQKFGFKRVGSYYRKDL